MGIKDKTLEIEELVQSFLDRKHLEDLYELTDDIRILSEAKNMELKRLQTLELIYDLPPILLYADVKPQMLVKDTKGNIGKIIDTEHDIHNVKVDYLDESGVGIYCLDETCEDYDPLYIIKKMESIENYKLELEVIEDPKGIFTAQIKGVRGAIVQEESKLKAIKEVFKQAWVCLEVDSKNFDYE